MPRPSAPPSRTTMCPVHGSGGPPYRRPACHSRGRTDTLPTQCQWTGFPSPTASPASPSASGASVQSPSRSKPPVGQCSGEWPHGASRSSPSWRTACSRTPGAPTSLSCGPSASNRGTSDASSRTTGSRGLWASCARPASTYASRSSRGSSRRSVVDGPFGFARRTSTTRLPGQASLARAGAPVAGPPASSSISTTSRPRRRTGRCGSTRTAGTDGRSSSSHRSIRGS